MSTLTEPFRIGQSVRILKSHYRLDTVAEIYTVVRCNELDSPNPSYVLENDANRRQRRESHNQLVSVVSDADAAADPFRRQETK